MYNIIVVKVKRKEEMKKNEKNILSISLDFIAKLWYNIIVKIKRKVKGNENDEKWKCKSC